MSNFVYVLTGGGEKKLKLRSVSDRIELVLKEWEALKETTGDCHSISFIKQLVGSSFDLTEVFKMRDPVHAAIHKLFFVWKDLLERAALMVLKKNKIEVPQFDSFSGSPSSPILHYFMKDREEHMEQRAVFSDIDFDYIGFCPLAAAERLSALLEFPIATLFSKVAELNLPVVFEVIYNEIGDCIKEPQKPTDELDIGDIHHEDCDELMLFLDKSRDHLGKLEKYYHTWAQSIDKISYIIQHNILNTFL